ncbi:synaptic vesicle VAT-1 family membrane protein [Sandaracinus amylolyticus]|uniref:Synaptic vesicle membrane protein VAT-1 n=1 Tax=Sandaracinus amylolyticus TaxID=927083 RepID=A0A0F6W177_9BACT|nr:medium chain dehydrogenase/reductase family protein [Sandaracinus amylolyticus]AKF04690.1 Synaptic vesicle membrane protein VAT-1 [Sandaracinus amylolyticus]
MRAVWIRKHGGPEVLEVRETPDPEPQAGEVRVRAKAVGLNFAEVTARQGLYPDAPKPPCVVGYEGAGVVDALGPGVTSLRVGQRVVFMKRFGAHADVVCVPEIQAVPMPESMSFEEGAAIPVNYLTAYHMLFRISRVRSGDSVLVHMVAGGVGTAAMQLCRTVDGLTTFGTCSASKHDYARSHGCQHPIDYRTKDYVEEVRRIQGGRGVDYVFDPLGGPDWKKGYSLLNESGMMVCFGMANVQVPGKRRLLHALGQVLQIPKFDPMKMMGDNKGVAGLNVGHLWHRLDMLRPEMDELVRLYERGIVKPHLDSVHPFEKAADAFARIEHGKNVGKVIMVP